ncbi:hypothetical protein Nepgr_000150 [Nepenthes gracilis]|uniref:C2 domain-containing protein n=1 Tax=Nepenthes gracilis TaxID=150966 RepID=A0AAD3RW69_NEPGR|nr:hypothetical protein Nepgr_000150 [Nepenthes gracilis]
MATSRPTENPLDLVITIVSAKHLKNVNWRNGDLEPYAVLWLDPDLRVATEPDSSSSTKPVWNKHFTVPLPVASSIHDSLLTLEIFHSKPYNNTKPLVGTARVRLSDLMNSDEPIRVHTLQLLRPSGRPQGKVRLKVGVHERPPPPTYLGYNHSSESGYYSSSAPPQPALHNYRDYSSPVYESHPPPHATPSPYSLSSYSDAYSGYHSNYYARTTQPQPLTPFSGYVAPPSGPSAPIGCSSYDHRSNVGALSGALGGSVLEQRAKDVDNEKKGEIVEGDAAGRENFGDYRGKY